MTTRYDCCTAHGLAHPCEACAVESGYEEVLADHRRLVRELDVLLNGLAGAARQASLCDIIGQVSDLVTCAGEMYCCLEAVDSEFVDHLELPRDWVRRAREALRKFPTNGKPKRQ